MSKRMQPAYFEEVEDDSEAVMPGTRVTAATPRSPPKEVRKSKASPPLSDDEHEPPSRSTRRDRRESRAAKKDRAVSREHSYERERNHSRENKERKRERVARRSSMHRPSKEHRNSTSHQEEQPGHDQQLTRTRSHNNRTPFNPPALPHGYQVPPQANANFYHHHPNQMMPAPHPHPQNNMFPPPPNMNMGPGLMHHHPHMMGVPMSMHAGTPQMMQPMLSMAGGPGNFNKYPPQPMNNYNFPQPPPVSNPNFMDAPNQRLGQQFAPPRPMSAQAVRRDSRNYDDYLDEAPHSGQLSTRRPSMRKRDGDSDRRRLIEDDKRKMPPPMRPKSARPVSGAYPRPPHGERSHLRNRSSVCEEDDIDDPGYYRSTSHDQDDYAPAGSSRPRQGSVGYTNRAPPSQRTRRLSSYHAQEPLSSSFNDGYEHAYTNLTNSMNTLALTSDALKKVSHANPSSSTYSTRSGGSRGDESEWLQPSVITQTTRSSNEEDVTIKIRGGDAIVNISGRDIQCRDGTELTLSSARPLSIRNDVEPPALDSVPYYSEERMARGERIPQRNRANSQANSFGYGSYDRRYEAPVYSYSRH
ncbi:uncharacterized protein BROUX77_006013 [Berkeleyomyces rouxiae]|uniref:uncharacterized protein n=1 Tax=Berkeleyomyces rouxiae TaxID=2035830 RepID=UPI003B77A555